MREGNSEIRRVRNTGMRVSTSALACPPLVQEAYGYRLQAGKGNNNEVCSKGRSRLLPQPRGPNGDTPLSQRPGMRAPTMALFLTGWLPESTIC